MIFHIYANQSNVGDWLSAKGIQSLLAPHRMTELFCDTPFVSPTIKALRDAGPRDFIVIGGGGLFMDYFAPFWEAFEPIAGKVPFAIWGAGSCDMKNEHTRPPMDLLTGIIRRSRLCVVRDTLTRDMFSACNLPAPVICPSVVAVTSRGGEQQRLLHVDHYDNVGHDIYEKMVAVAEKFASASGRSYRQINNLIPSGHAGALEHALDLYASADLVVTSRLHGAIIALAMGRRTLIVSGDYKVESFMDAAGLRDWVVDLDDISALPDRLARLHEQELPVAFVEEGRRQNARIGQEIHRLIDPTTRPGLPANTE